MIRPLLALLVTSAALAYTRDDVLLYVPFDGSLQPAVAAEGTAPIVAEGATFEFGPGAVGQAVRTGLPDSLIQYPTAGNLNPTEGTFAIWVQSLNWTLDDAPKRNRWWIDVSGPTRFIIYHYVHSAGMFFYHMDERREHPSIIKAPGPWVAGEWKHLVGTWKDGRLRFYVDGVKVPEELQVELGPAADQIRLGDPNSQTGAAQTPDTQLDEFYVFRRALEDVEVRSLYLRGARDDQAAVAIPPGLSPTVDGSLAAGEWAAAAAVTGFTNSVTGLLDPEQSVAWLGHDATNLYLAHRWPIPARVLQQPDNYSFGAFRGEADARDGALLVNDDTVGLELIGPDGVPKTLLINRLGEIGDWAGDVDQVESWTGFNANAQAVCRVADGAWTLELAVPLADLGLAPGETVGLRIVRRHALLRQDQAGWPAAAGVSAAATLATEPGAVQLTSLGDLGLGQVDLALTAGAAPVAAIIATDSAELSRDEALAAGATLAVEQTLTQTEVTALTVTATAAGRTLLAMAAPFSYPPMLEVDHFLYPSRDRLEVVLSTRGAASAAPASVTVAPAGVTATVAQTDLAGGGGDSRIAAVDLAELAPGDYTATVVVGAGEQTFGRQEFSFKLLPKPDWLGTDAGRLDHVPAPWTPIAVEGRKLSVWGRTVDLTGALLPAQIGSQGEPLLTAPVALVAGAGDQEYRAGEAAVELLEQGDQKVAWRSRAALGPVTATVDGWMEFDGLLWFTVTLNSEQPATLDRLRLEIPFAKEHSTLLYSGDYRTIDTGATPTERWTRDPAACLGLSDEERGMQWFMESREGWNLGNLKEAIEVLPEAETNRLVIHFIDQPTVIAGPRRLAFGLHPAPIKPPLPGRRMIRPWGDYDKEPKPNLALWMTHWCLGCSYALPVAERMPATIADRHDRLNTRPMLYTRLAECSVKGPWYAYFRDEWRIDPGPRMAFDPEADWGAANPVCQNSASWQDWTAWSFREAYRQIDADGVYYDVSRPAFCMNQHHGCGFVNEEGKVEPVRQILATRELQKRMWVVMHEQVGRERLVTHHMSGDLWTATQSFSDVIVDGENYTSMLKDNYYELLPLDKFRAEFMGHQWGLPSVFLPEFSRAQLTPEGQEQYLSAEKLPEVRHLAGMIFLHDSLPWPAYSDVTPYHTIWAAQDALGWGDEVEFLPYWNNQDLVQPMGADLVASIFRRDGRALLVLFNNTDQPQQAPVKLDLDALGVKATALRDFETDEVFPLTDGAATIPVVKRNYRLLLSE